MMMTINYSNRWIVTQSAKLNERLIVLISRPVLYHLWMMTTPVRQRGDVWYSLRFHSIRVIYGLESIGTGLPVKNVARSMCMFVWLFGKSRGNEVHSVLFTGNNCYVFRKGVSDGCTKNIVIALS